LFAVNFAVDVGGGGTVRDAASVVDDPDFELIVAVGKLHANHQSVAELVAVFNGVDAGLRDGGLKVFDPVKREAHQLRHAGGGAHGHFLKAQFRRKIYLYSASVSHGWTNSC